MTSYLITRTYRLKVFEIRVLRILPPKTQEVTGGWRKLHNLYSSLNNYYLRDQIEDERSGTCSTHGRTINAYILHGKLEGKRPLRTSRRKWENNIKINTKETYLCGPDSTGTGQAPVAGPCEYCNEAYTTSQPRRRKSTP
jgi:hypothetical protein